jgi:hypothetical protein
LPRRNQIGESLAGAGTCFDDQYLVAAYRLGHRQRHLALLFARTE